MASAYVQINQATGNQDLVFFKNLNNSIIDDIFETGPIPVVGGMVQFGLNIEVGVDLAPSFYQSGANVMGEANFLNTLRIGAVTGFARQN